MLCDRHINNNKHVSCTLQLQFTFIYLFSFKLWAFVWSEQAAIRWYRNRSSEMLTVVLLGQQLENSSYSNLVTQDPVSLPPRSKWHHAPKNCESAGKIYHCCFKFNFAFSGSVWGKVSGNFHVKKACKEKQASCGMAEIPAQPYPENEILAYVRAQRSSLHGRAACLQRDIRK